MCVKNEFFLLYNIKRKISNFLEKENIFIKLK